MKLFLLGLALLATTYAQYASEYQVPQDSLAAIEEIETLEEPSNLLADDGYRYKTVRRLRLRHRRDVSELASPEYLPPVQELAVEAPVNEYLAPVAPVAPVAEIASGVLANDGYHYKTVKRYRLRRRRDVNELASQEYLPPVQELSVEAPSNEYLAPIAPLAPVAEIASGVLADDGYRYKTVRRLRLRHRRDVNELASAEYLPPVQELAVEAPVNEYLAPVAPVAPVAEIASGVLADDGYRYKTVRHRRDVNELASAEYLPPVQELAVEAPVNEYLAPVAPVAPVAEIASGVLADDGYRYKTVRRLRLRHRRDVNELASAEYLPPVQELAVEAPVNEYLAPVAPVAPVAEIASGVLADDGYRYKTVRRLRLRHRRDVNELASAEYLPPVQELAVEAPVNEYLAPVAPVAPVAEIASGVLADDGYRYKTVRRLRLRHRRDVNELASAEYLPPVQELAVEAPVNEYLAPVAPVAPVAEIASGVLADDGYRYKTVKRFRLRHRRDVNELANAEYLPPTVSAAPAPFVADIPVISNEYLAPVEQNENILADDGYRYKTVRRFKIRRH